MGRLQTWGAAARRSRLVQVVAAVVVARPGRRGASCWRRGARPARRPARAPPLSTRAVALGDSVPYGHGLANPYLTPQIGLPDRRGLPGALHAGLPEPWWRRTSGSP